MVGNDVVDLRDPDCDPATLHPRFDERVFAPDERRALLFASAQRGALLPSEDPSSAGGASLRWRFWAAKEAAYKAVVKLHPHVVFSPARFRTEWSTAERGFVTCDAARCEVRVEEREGSVHAVARVVGARLREVPGRAAHGLFEGVYRAAPRDGIAEDPEAPGRIVRAFARLRLAAVLGLDVRALAIRKRGRVPELWFDGQPTGCDLSLSHHGAVVAFACDTTGFSPTRATELVRASA
jgi:phosphopantetheinyl transferase (holo-ACP synthase)